MYIVRFLKAILLVGSPVTAKIEIPKPETIEIVVEAKDNGKEDPLIEFMKECVMINPPNKNAGDRSGDNFWSDARKALKELYPHPTKSSIRDELDQIGKKETQ